MPISVVGAAEQVLRAQMQAQMPVLAEMGIHLLFLA